MPVVKFCLFTLRSVRMPARAFMRTKERKNNGVNKGQILVCYEREREKDRKRMREGFIRSSKKRTALVAGEQHLRRPRLLHQFSTTTPTTTTRLQSEARVVRMLKTNRCYCWQTETPRRLSKTSFFLPPHPLRSSTTTTTKSPTAFCRNDDDENPKRCYYYYCSSLSSSRGRRNRDARSSSSSSSSSSFFARTRRRNEGKTTSSSFTTTTLFCLLVKRGRVLRKKREQNEENSRQGG